MIESKESCKFGSIYYDYSIWEVVKTREKVKFYDRRCSWSIYALALIIRAGLYQMAHR